MATDETQKAILRVCSYTLEDVPEPPTVSSLSGVNNVQESLMTPFKTRPVSDLGLLRKLPNELLAMILRFADVRSVFRFRQLNQLSRVISTAVPQYHIVAKHWPRGLQNILRTFSGQHVALNDLHITFISDRCAYCEDFGSYLCLYTGWRCCYVCLVSSRVFWFEHKAHEVNMIATQCPCSKGCHQGRHKHAKRALVVFKTLDQPAVADLPWLMSAFQKTGA